MEQVQPQSAPRSAIVGFRDKRRICLQTDKLKGTPLFVPRSMKSSPTSQYAGSWMRSSTKDKAKQNSKFIERVLEFKEAQVSYFCNFFKLEQGIMQIIRFVSCINDDELAMKVNGLINYIKSWPDPNQIPRPARAKQQMAYGMRNDANNESVQSQKRNIFSSATASPDDSFNLNSNQSPPRNFSQTSTPISSNSTSFFRNSPPTISPINRPYFISIKSDFRYSNIKELSRILINGMSEENVDFPQTDQHFFINIINSNVNVNGCMQIRWPVSLQIFINGRILKNAGDEIFCNFVDLTEFNPRTIKFLSQDPSCRCEISIISATFTSYPDIISKARVVDQVETGNNFSFNLLFCPITGKLMKFPGRGIHCMHQQCFDVKNFMKIVSINGQNICPICQTKIEPNELVISKVTTNAVNMVRVSSLQQQNEQEKRNVENIYENGNQNEQNNSNFKLVEFPNEDAGLSEDHIFSDFEDPLSLELDNNPFSNES